MVRDRERGAALVVSLICVMGLLAIGAVTLLAVQSELRSAGAGRTRQQALYAAESGIAAAMEFLRAQCGNGNMFSDFVEPSNVAPQKPRGILGNGVRPGRSGNPFLPDLESWYDVALLNDIADPGYATGDDFNATVIVRSTGFGPDQTTFVVEMEIHMPTCLSEFCETEYAQEGVSARNDAFALCATAIDPAGALRSIEVAP